ncbi:MAG: Gfo/Idh/MocA family oxidoreductase [Propionibacteriaceae bacterium]|nr:Gfo/Idh/MocA family oxidoreductase [Propionibacteriaceae bacterium]
MANLRYGLLGVGMMGRHHARVLREIEGIDLVAIADPGGDPHHVAGDLPILPDVEALISAEIDVAVVAAPTQFHEEVALKLASAKVHVMVEKPIAHSVEAGERMMRAFETAGVFGAVGHIERYNAALQEMRRRIAEGQLGEIFQIATRRQSQFPGRIADVGVAKDLASHDIDLTAWVAQSQYSSIHAETTFRSGRTHEDMFLAIGTLDNGVIVNHIVNWLSPMKERTTVVTGEKGTFVADLLTSDLTYYANGTVPTSWDTVSAFRGVSEGDVTRYAFVKPEPLRCEHEALRDTILGKTSTAVTMGEGLRTLQVVELALEASQDGGNHRQIS